MTQQATTPVNGTTEYSLDGSGDIGLDELVLDDQSTPEVLDETPVIAPDTPAETGDQADAPAAAPGVSEEENRLRTENTRLTREAREQQDAAWEANLRTDANTEANNLIRSLIADGMDQATAQRIGVAEIGLQVERYRAQTANLRVTRIELVHEFGVPEEELRGFQDEAGMRHHAERYASTTGPQAARLQAVEKELADFKSQILKSGVPAQNFNQPGGAGGQRVTSENIDALHVNWDNEHPGQQDSNPYTARYRQFLNR